ncbi:MAG: metallophosphoesterase [Candidatus Heimdallarchaeota archaeon]|nr:metallophosphoesterase [Candidatus Heimdallarchaeota archaeon]MCK4877156.1 metallophosphoesterase [Candidatus Heimdallarchaeota archaeon]
MHEKIIPPEHRIPSRTYRVKIKETIRERLAEEENFYVLELDDFDKVEYRPYDTTEEKKDDLPKIRFVLDKVYLQKMVDDSSKLLCSVYIDYGYLKTNRVKELVEVNKKKPFLSEPKGWCMIRLFNSDYCEIAEIPMKHSSEFRFHPVTGAPQLFLGLIENLEERKEYHYRIECYDEEDKLIGASRIKQFVGGVQKTNKPIFYVTASDLHGGSKAGFKRGKVRWFKAKNNPRLLDLMENINYKELEYTFGYGYQLFATSGDNIDNGSYHEYWADFFSCGNINFSRMPLLPTIGNHDYYNGGWGRASWFGGKKRTQKHFHMFVQTPREKGGAFYSHVEGNVLMIHLDSVGLKWGNESITCESRQWLWLNEELRKWRNKLIETGEGPEYCIIHLHSAIFTIGFFGRARNNSDAIAQSCLTPIIDHYGIAATIFGHDHMYQRSKRNNTSYMCIGVSGKIPIKYFKFLRNKVDYTINEDEEGERARGYGVTYVPPKLKEMNIPERKEFEEWLMKIKETIIIGDLLKYYAFEEGQDSPEYKKAMTNKNTKTEFIQNEIIEKMKTSIWWRYYNLKGELVDHVFIERIEMKDGLTESISCPGPHIR